MRILLFSLLFALLASCSATKQIQEHRQQLMAATGADVPLSQKRDALGSSTVAMMHQAVRRLNPKKGAKYVQAYAKTNGPLLDTLAAQIRKGQADMKTSDKIAFALSGASEPYARDAIELVPKFIAKYKQIQAVSRITGNLKDAVLGNAADKLGGLLDGLSGDVEVPEQDVPGELVGNEVGVAR